MSSEQLIITVDDSTFMDKIQETAHAGYRLVQMCATKVPDGFELSYSFAKDLDFMTLRYQIAEDKEITSISSIFAPAFLYENEMKDLFGIKIKMISLDYNGNFYQTSLKTPMNPKEQA